MDSDRVEALREAAQRAVKHELRRALCNNCGSDVGQWRTQFEGLANPQAVLDLLDRLDALDEEAKATAASAVVLLRDVARDRDKAEAERDEARAEAASLRAEVERREHARGLFFDTLHSVYNNASSGWPEADAYRDGLDRAEEIAEDAFGDRPH